MREVIITEQNKNGNAFDETRSFAVSGNNKPNPTHNPNRKPAPKPGNAGAEPKRRPAPQGSASARPVSEQLKARPTRDPAAKPAPTAAPSGQASGRAPGTSVAARKPAPRSTVNPQAAELRVPANYAPVSEGEQSTKPVPAEVKQQMMNTKSPVGVAPASKKRDYVDEEWEGSGEGGNTVISILKAIVYIVFVCVVSAFLAVTVIFVANDVFAFIKDDKAVEVVLPDNVTLDRLAEILHENDVIEYPSVFKLYAKVKKDNQKYIGGTYTVNPTMNYSFLLAEFKEKIDYGTIRITIPEGFTTDEIIDLFVSNGIGTRDGFVDAIENGEYNYWFIEELEANGISESRIYRLDGYLFPDTYDFYKSSSEKTVINKLLKRFGQIFTKEHREQCAMMGYTVDDIVTLASIIEKEAANSAEFFKVSSVFHNRLNNPWVFPKLESDATVVYAIHHETGERDVNLNYDSPYNTYKFNGLTPGPIANPSASAMLAALLPNETNYYFFYAYGGTTYFSETKAEHDAIIEKFRNQAAQSQQNVPAN